MAAVRFGKHRLYRAQVSDIAETVRNVAGSEVAEIHLSAWEVAALRAAADLVEHLRDTAWQPEPPKCPTCGHRPPPEE